MSQRIVLTKENMASLSRRLGPFSSPVSSILRFLTKSTLLMRTGSSLSVQLHEGSSLLFWVDRSDDIVRIVSARMATHRETKFLAERIRGLNE